MATIYGPDNISEKPDSTEVSPHMEIIPGLRVIFHESGISFAVVDLKDERFAALIDYAKARQMLIEAAAVDQD